MAKTKYYVKLNDSQREFLTKIVRERNESERTILRARILLLSEESQSMKRSIRELAEELQTTETTIKTVRTEFATKGIEETVFRKKRVVPIQTRKINESVIQQILAIASSEPPPGKWKWSARMLCTEAMERGIVDHIGVTAMCEILKQHKPSNKKTKYEKTSPD